MIEYILTDQMRAWAKAHGWDADLHYEWFCDYLSNKQGKPYRDLDAAFRNCIRSDWGGLRRQAQFAPKQPTYSPPAAYKIPDVEETPELAENRARVMIMARKLANKLVVK